MMKIMHHIFSDILGRCVYIYIDDIFVFSDTYEQHLKDVPLVLLILEKHHFTASKEKSAFMPTVMEVLGCVITKNGISAAPDKLETIANFPISETRQALQEFNGMTNYPSRFVPQLSTLAAPLTELAGSTTTWE